MPTWARVSRSLGLAAVVAAPVAVLALVIRAEGSPVVALDQAAIRAATDITRSSPALREALLVWQELLQARWVNLALLGLCGWLWHRHAMRSRVLWAVVTLLGSWGLVNVVKLVVRRARPTVDDAIALAPGYSFPSGHASNTAAAGLTLVLLLWPLLGPRGRVALPAGVAVVVVLTALDRVFLGVHYPSDVVAGVVFGVTVAGASYLGYRRPRDGSLTSPAERTGG